HVLRRAEDRAGLRRAGGAVEPLGEAEIGDLGHPVGGQPDIGRLQIAADAALPVGVVHRPGQRLDELRGPAGRLRRAVAAGGRAGGGAADGAVGEAVGERADVGRPIVTVRTAEGGGHAAPRRRDGDGAIKIAYVWVGPVWPWV